MVFRCNDSLAEFFLLLGQDNVSVFCFFTVIGFFAPQIMNMSISIILAPFIKHQWPSLGVVLLHLLVRVTLHQLLLTRLSWCKVAFILVLWWRHLHRRRCPTLWMIDNDDHCGAVALVSRIKREILSRDQQTLLRITFSLLAALFLVFHFFHKFQFNIRFVWLYSLSFKI